MISNRIIILSFVLLCMLLPSLPAEAQEADIRLERIAAGTEFPVFVTSLPHRSDTLFIVEQTGRVLRLRNGNLRTFMDIRDIVGSGGERGLLSIAFPENWEKRRFFFVMYTDTNGDSVLARYRTKKKRRFQVRLRSAKVVLRQDQPFSNHNGGQIAFGPDGLLYIGFGDGGSGGDPLEAGQDINTWLGKILRINVDRRNYRVPEDNPFVGQEGLDEIWALGLRNPWRFSFDMSTGDLYIADVGQGAVEEINVEPAGDAGGNNYGWNIREGSRDFDPDAVPGTLPLVDPVHEYTHDVGSSITGGYVYRGTAIPELDGHYFYADFVSQRIWSLKHVAGEENEIVEWTNQLRSANGDSLSITSFGQDADGELYICDYFTGDVYKIIPVK